MKAFNENKYFQELCKRNDVWVNIKPIQTDTIYSGLDTDIFVSQINAQNNKQRKNLTSHITAKLYGDPLYFYNLESSYRNHAEDIIQGFLKDPCGINSVVRKFFGIY